MQIVPYQKEDFDGAADILSSCIDDPRRELSEYLENDNVRIYCAKKGGILCGVICLLVSFDVTDILDIAVLKTERKKGIGKLLVDFAATSFPVLMLEVREGNAPARALYEKCGFENISVRKNYYGNPTENAIIYRRENK